MSETRTIKEICSQCGGDGFIPVDWDDHVPYHSCYRCGESGYETFAATVVRSVNALMYQVESQGPLHYFVVEPNGRKFWHRVKAYCEHGIILYHCSKFELERVEAKLAEVVVKAPEPEPWVGSASGSSPEEIPF